MKKSTILIKSASGLLILFLLSPSLLQLNQLFLAFGVYEYIFSRTEISWVSLILFFSYYAIPVFIATVSFFYAKHFFSKELKKKYISRIFFTLNLLFLALIIFIFIRFGIFVFEGL